MKTREEEILAANVSGPRILNGTIHLEPYDSRWPEQYQQEARRIQQILGDTVKQLEHVGSTSVAGLAAKPVIDMVLVVDDASVETAYVEPLQAKGYRLRIREPDWFEHRLLAPPDLDANIHVFSAGCEEVERMLRFRDWLRSHPQDLKFYQETKRELASRTWKYVQNYADAKSDVIRQILARAERA